MSEHKLTDAEGIEVESFYDGQSKQTREGKLEVDRWTKYGHDRLYINAGIPKCDKYSLYVDLEAHEIVSDNDGKHKGGSVKIDGDTATITIIEGGIEDKEHEITVSLDGDGFEVAEEKDEDSEDDTEIVADGGEDATEHVDDETIEDAIQQHDDPEHEDALTIEDVRGLLARLQQSIERCWGEISDGIERGNYTVVAESDDLLLIDTGKHRPYDDDPEVYAEHPDDVDEIDVSVVSSIQHRLARQLEPDRQWSSTYPLVIRKPDGFAAGQEYVDAVVNGLQRRGLSPGQAWAYYGVVIRGNSRNSWGVRKGDHDHKNVSDALEKAKQKLP